MSERTCSVDGCPNVVLCKGVCSMHYTRIRKHGDPHVSLTGGTEVERFWRKVKRAEGRHEDRCWLWIGGLTGAGYGIFSCEPRKPDGRLTSKGAHRYAYELLVGPIADGLVLDHLCRVPACVNPAHLEPVTQEENLRRGNPSASAMNRGKTHCVNGHEFTEQNTYWFNKGRSRGCLTCRREASRRWNERVSAERKRGAA